MALALPAGRTKTNQARSSPWGLACAPCSNCGGLLNGKELPATAHVFGDACGEPVTTIRAQWEKACQAAGIRGLHFHDLRREFACRLLELTADLHDVRISSDTRTSRRPFPT